MFRTILLFAIVSMNEVLTRRQLSIPECPTESKIRYGVKLKGSLPKEFGHSYICRFFVKSGAVFLDIQGRKESIGSLQVGVFNIYPRILKTMGRLEVANKTADQRLTCLKAKWSTNWFAVMISGTPSLKFIVKVQLISGPLQLRIEKPFSRSMLFYFIPNKKTSTKAQLDVSVKSSTGGDAVLKVSSFCDQVEQLDAYHPKKPTLSLTFERQARITLSKFSNPATSEKPLFIGIILSHESSNIDKNFTIEISTSFDYNYAGPICFIVLVPFFGGILIALWATFCFSEQFLSSVEVGKIVQSPSEHSTYHDMTQNQRSGRIGVAQKTSVIKAMFKVLEYRSAEWKAFSYITCVVGSVLFVGAFQFVYENWNNMIKEGNRDNCFYNDLCYRVGFYSDIPFNLMISNLTYIIHGIILAVAVWIMEAKFYIQAREKALLNMPENMETPDNQYTILDEESLPRHTLLCTNMNAHLPELSVPTFQPDDRRLLELFAQAHKRKCSFSIGYAMAWALVYEGIFSLTYHLCPTRLTFQFDSAFMFVIAGLIIVSLFNGMSNSKCPQEHNFPEPIEASSFFLFGIVPLYLLNYFGSVYDLHDHETRVLLLVLFLVLISVWYPFMLVWAGRKLCCTNILAGAYKAILLCIAVVITWVVLPLKFYKDLPNMFLFSALTIAVLSIIGKFPNVCREPACTRPMDTRTMIVLRVLYYLVAPGVLIAALYVFYNIPTTEKTDTPAQSRNHNKECALLGFFDHHDIWHILSSFALLMVDFFVMYISEF